MTLAELLSPIPLVKIVDWNPAGFLMVLLAAFAASPILGGAGGFGGFGAPPPPKHLISNMPWREGQFISPSNSNFFMLRNLSKHLFCGVPHHFTPSLKLSRPAYVI